MLPGQLTVRAPQSSHRIALPLGAALVIWAGALVIGSLLNLYAPHGQTVTAAQLDAVETDWQLQDGTLAISVRQMGSDVTGSFADWTAAIRFDETVQEGRAGDVDVTISIGSLTLGSVTSQAMAADFFNVAAFPTAQFKAEILRTAAGYEAAGTLTIKDKSLPVTLPFTLEVNEGTATMSGNTALDRRDFAIGHGQKDENSLGFGVDVTVTLTATRAK
jgi:polyisoprenoid-binding protein YceI